MKEILKLSIKANLYQHQQNACRFACERFGILPSEVHSNGVALLMEMGCGKTITSIAISGILHEYRHIKRILITAPLSILGVWEQEFERFADFPYQLTVLKGSSSQKKEQLSKLHGNTLQIAVVNYEAVWRLEKELLSFNADLIIADELSSFKNHQSKRFKALMKVRPKVKRIVGLTGTPASNGLMDLFAEFKLLDMGEHLGRFIGQYRNEYFKPDKQNGYIVYSYKPLPNAEERIYDKISDIIVSMKAVDHLKMPELVSTEYAVKMSDAEKEKYKELKDELILEVQDTEITAANAAALSNKLCQMSNGAVYDDENNIIPIHSRKLDALEDIIESANGKPVLVAYWFKHDRTRIAERLGKLGIVYQEIKSAQSIKNWNSGKLRWH